MSHLLTSPLAYRLWQAPFAKAKFAPVHRHNDMSDVRRVLDVACGPGTNTHHFEEADYLGIDINERFVQYAHRRHGRRFVVADATHLSVAADERFDFILVNSFLHHIPDNEVRELLARLSTLLAADGHVHVLELELPERASVARLLARMDRGDHPRPRAEWQRLLSESLEPVVVEPYRLEPWPGGPTLWNMVYFKGRARTGQAH
jgi:ubiquinone/menaquinone biosynthesis C-methylase UbiE